MACSPATILLKPVKMIPLVTDHSAVIQNLQPKTTYHYRLTGLDVCGNEAVSSDGSFTTAENGVMPGKLTISNVTVYDITSSNAWISWVTTKPSTTYRQLQGG